MSAKPAHGSVLLPGRRRVSRAPAQVPVAGQLLHDRLVQRVAGGCAALGGVPVPQGRQDGHRRHSRVDAGHVHAVPSGRPQPRGQVPRRTRPIQLRHPDVVPRAHRHLPQAAQREARRGADDDQQVRGRLSADLRSRGLRRSHEDGTHRPPTRARAHRGGDRGDHQAGERRDHRRGQGEG